MKKVFIKAIFTVLVIVAAVAIMRVIFGGDETSPDKNQSKTALSWVDTLWKEKVQVKVAVVGGLSEAIVQPARIKPKGKWATFEVEGVVLCKSPALKYKLFSPTRFLYVKSGDKRYKLYAESPTTIPVSPGESIHVRVVSGEGLDGILKTKVNTGIISSSDFYPRAIDVRVTYSNEPFDKAQKAEEIEEVSNLLPNVTGERAAMSAAERVVDRFKESKKEAKDLQSDAVKDAQDWIERNGDQFPQIDAAKIARKFQAWEKKKLNDIPNKVSQLNDRLFQDPFYRSLENRDVGYDEVKEMVIETVLVLWNDPQIQEYLSDPSKYHLIFEDIRVDTLLSDSEVRAFLSDSSRIQSVLNDSRMRPVVNDPQIRALYKDRIAKK